MSRGRRFFVRISEIMNFVLIKTGEPCTYKECLMETIQIVDAHNRAKEKECPDGPRYVIHWKAHKGPAAGNGSPVSIETARVTSDNPDLQPNDTWRDTYASYWLVPVDGKIF